MILRKFTVVATTTLAVTMGIAALLPSPVAGKTAPKPASSNVKLIATGKKIIVTRCIKCHGTNLEGKPKRVPPLTAKGPVRHYTQATFERLMAKSVDKENKPIEAPMSRIHLSKADSDAVWAYLKTVK